MKKCSKCGSVLVEGAKFCRICGEPVPQDTFEEVTLTETGIAADLPQPAGTAAGLPAQTGTTQDISENTGRAHRPHKNDIPVQTGPDQDIKAKDNNIEKSQDQDSKVPDTAPRPAKHRQGYQDPAYAAILEEIEKKQKAQKEAAAKSDGEIPGSSVSSADTESAGSRDNTPRASSVTEILPGVSAGGKTGSSVSGRKKLPLIPAAIVAAIVVLFLILVTRFMGSGSGMTREKARDVAWSDSVLEMRMRDIMDNDKKDFMPVDAWDLEELDLSTEYYSDTLYFFYSYPEITDISAVKAFGSLKKLNLYGNKISDITALENLDRKSVV